MTKKVNIFLTIGFLMLIFAIGFITLALTHPELSFPWSNSITYIIYFIYCIIMLVMFIMSLIFKHN